MALITVGAVVDVALHSLVVLVGLSLGVTNRAGKHRVVRRVRVAVSAPACASVVHGEPGVVELRVQPCGCVMAGLASGRESSRFVVRVGGAVVVLLVTGITVRGNVFVVVVHMALIAGHGLVRAGQGELRFIVIKGCGNPRRRVVAHFTLLRESYLRMIGVIGLVVVRQVAGHASCVSQFVVTVDVTLRTLQRGMEAGQGPSGFAMVEPCPRPG